MFSGVPAALPADRIGEPIDVLSLARAYREGRDPYSDLDAVYDRIETVGLKPIWISLMPRERARALLAEAETRKSSGACLPLFGVPFAVKDNIDVAGLPTTAGCPAYAYGPERSAFAVERLVAAGAIPVGKTNLDQFATGLNGTRSPYGIPACAFDKRFVSGGSSSGSAVAVALGLVPFALGTDTAGSGRVPAGFNNVVGLKPTKGLVSTRGVVPACRTQDCVSIFAGAVADAVAVLQAAAAYDPDDSFSRAAPDQPPARFDVPRLRFGTPSPKMLDACDAPARERFESAAATLETLGATRVEIDLTPFQEAAALLYSGPWVVERLAAIRDFLATDPEAVHPVVRDVVRSGERYGAIDVFEAQYRLAALVRRSKPVWDAIDLLFLPTAPGHPTIVDMLADPVALNSRLGLFTNFVNLMDLAALAVPAGFDDRGLPAGVTLVGPTFSDEALAVVGDRLHRAMPGATIGASRRPVASAPALVVRNAPAERENRVHVAVVGAHLRGQPLNRELTDRGGALVASKRTADGYSLYAIFGTEPPKPGLVRDGGRGGVEVEIWSLPVAAFGAFVSEIAAPLCIGTVALEDGSAVKGFLCETQAVQGAKNITGFGGWRAYLAARDEAA